MAPALLFLCLFFFSLRDFSLSAPTDNKQNDSSTDLPEILPRPRADIKTAVVHGDVAMPTTLGRNADPCTARGCRWPKTGRYVYVPYYISPDYTQQERGVILAGLQSFHQSTCVRFVPWTQTHRDYLHFLSSPGEGCKSFIGRQDGGQGVFLEKKGCVSQSTVQHEVLHALGFHHEQVRSDRDQYVRILSQNVQPDQLKNFQKVPTNNLLTPYDFSSVMHYGKYDFSSNGLPTIVAKHNYYLDFGHAHQMSPNDITRVNRLYGCKRWSRRRA
ncbi:hatching enzyme 1.2-like [Menidia menidia]